MHANPERLQVPERGSSSQLHAMHRRNTLGPFMSRFLRLLRLAFWRAFQHDAFATAKAAAYSSILTFFPALLVIGSVLATSRQTEAYLLEISDAVSKILPAGAATSVLVPALLHVDPEADLAHPGDPHQAGRLVTLGDVRDDVPT